MIDVMFYLKDGLIMGFSAQGHALFAPRGEDIVCAGVSALLQSAAGYLALQGVPLLRLQSKRMLLRVKQSAPYASKRLASDILGAALTGVASTAASYPGTIRLRLHRRRQ